jgi:hypothetical protein
MVCHHFQIQQRKLVTLPLKLHVCGVIDCRCGSTPVTPITTLQAVLVEVWAMLFGDSELGVCVRCLVNFCGIHLNIGCNCSKMYCVEKKLINVLISG